MRSTAAHADTRLDAGCAAALSGYLAGPPVWGRFDLRLEAPGAVFRVIETMINLRSRITGVATGDQAMFVSTALLEAAGGVPPLPLMEDVALSDRLRRLVRPHCLRTRVTTSARRWQRRGVIPTVLLMWCLRAAYRFGVAPERLQRWYVEARG